MMLSIDSGLSFENVAIYSSEALLFPLIELALAVVCLHRIQRSVPVHPAKRAKVKVQPDDGQASE